MPHVSFPLSVQLQPVRPLAPHQLQGRLPQLDIYMYVNMIYIYIYIYIYLYIYIYIHTYACLTRVFALSAQLQPVRPPAPYCKCIYIHTYIYIYIYIYIYTHIGLT